jgi:chromosome segregation ATPase
VSPICSVAVRRSLVAVSIVAFVVLAGAAAYLATASRSNHASAARWRERAQQSERLLTARTSQLNTRSKALDRAAGELERSQADVKTLEARQRTLANEKAQVEDQRGGLQLQTSQLAALAGEQRDCSSGLSQLLNEFAAGDYDAVNGNATTVGNACQKAQDDFAAFQSQYGGG